MKIQTATAGMSLTNGETYSKTVYLPDESDYWQEIPDSEVPVIDDETGEVVISSLEERVTDIEQVTTDVITALNEKGIVA